MPIDPLPAPPSPSSPAQTRAPELSAGLLISRCLSVWWENVWRFAGVSAVVIVPAFVLAFAIGVGAAATGSAHDSDLLITLIVLIIVPILLLGMMVQMGGVTQGVLEDLHGRPPRFSPMLSAGFGRFFPLLGVALVAGLLIVGGLLLLVVPGFVVAISVMVSVPVMVAEARGPVDAVRRSWELTRGSRGALFLAALGVGAIHFGINLVSNVLGLIPVLGTLAALFIQTLAMSLTAVLPAVAYHELRTAKEGAPTDGLARVFE